MEMGLCQFIIMGLVEGDVNLSNTMLWRDWLYPFAMEGTAVVIIALFLHPFYLWLKKKLPGKKQILAYAVSFLSGALLCGVIEFVVGSIGNADYSLWDYRQYFCNINGQVCLQNTMAFGAVAAIITWWVYPLLDNWISKVSNDVMNIVAVIVIVFGAILWALYVFKLPGARDQDVAPSSTSAAIVMYDQHT